MDEYFGVAKVMGITREEIEAIQAIVMAVSGGRVRAQFRAARMLGAESRRTRD
jgi:hypothetical protein